MNKFVDVLIVGSGVSGLYSALNLNDELRVLVVCKDKISCTNTYLAQGGISVARGEEDIPFFMQDTLRAGQNKNKIEAVEVLAKESIENIEQLIDLGVNFDKDDNGNIDFTKEGAHSINRIVHTKDNTGESVAEVLIKSVYNRNNIEIYEDTLFVDIIQENNECIGGILLKDEEQINVYAKYVILATGGIGGLYNNSTNQRILKGDGLVVAIKHNIKMKDLNYIQIHPTAFYEETNSRRLLISESIRGEGGILTNITGERFVNELLPRDVVSKAVYEQMEATDTPYVYLDIRSLGEEYIKNRFESIYNECLKRGTDITKEFIKVAPVQHFFMGGIEVDLEAKTSMKNLFAVGETSCTGVHGANRLASNSLLEGLVFSKRAAKFINKNIDMNTENKVKNVNKLNKTHKEIEFENEILVRETIKTEGGKLDNELFSYR